MRSLPLLSFLMLVLSIGCNQPAADTSELEGIRECECDSLSGNDLRASHPESANDTAYLPIQGALMATRFKTLEDLKTVVKIDYIDENGQVQSDSSNGSLVRLTHCSNGREVRSILETGVSEGDFKKAQSGGIGEKLDLGLISSYAVVNRRDLQRVYILARRRPNLYGEGDVAFFDLAESSVKNINTEDLAYRHAIDSSEKGYINTFNHMTAQAFITTFFSEEMADFVADVHERHHMPELISGKFTEKQLSDPEKNPVDNYVDIINNEWGQELGKNLKEKYQIDKDTQWTPELLTNYLNDIQSYYSWALQIGFKPFRTDDEVITRFAGKINQVLIDIPD